MRFLSHHLCLFLWEHRWPLTVAGAMLAMALCAPLAWSQSYANALPEVNRVRAARGLFPLLPDPRLQRAAEWKATYMASRRLSGHPLRGCWPGRAEGTGNTSGRDPYGRRFLSCMHSPGDYTRRHRYAGAAAAVSPRGGTYYVLILR